MSGRQGHEEPADILSSVTAIANSIASDPGSRKKLAESEGFMPLLEKLAVLGTTRDDNARNLAHKSFILEVLKIVLSAIVALAVLGAVLWQGDPDTKQKALLIAIGAAFGGGSGYALGRTGKDKQ